MNDASNGVLVALVGVLTLITVFSVGAFIQSGKIIHQCQNFEKFTSEEKLYECKELGVAK